MYYVAWESDIAKFDLSGQTETNLQKCYLNRISNDMHVAWNIPVKIIFHVFDIHTC